MINPIDFIKTFEQNKINFFTGVPDSLMKNFCNIVEKKKNHISSSNEGAAVGIGIGYNLAKGKVPLVYLQNSGLGNIINPITSLVNKDVYKIPIFFLIGWRGEKDFKGLKLTDEPQHKFQGRVTEKLLNNLQIKFKILNSKSNYKQMIKELKNYAINKSSPVALLVRKNTFLNLKLEKKIKNNFLNRESIIKTIVNEVPRNTPIISTTGYTSRELLEVSKDSNKTNNFYCVGGMGHAISIATGLAFSKKNKKIICIDGDGAALMHLGSQASASFNKNLIHIIIKNNVHESVGGQDIASNKINFHKVAKNLGYRLSFSCKTKNEIKKSLKFIFKKKMSSFIEIISTAGHKKELARPQKSMLYYKNRFIKLL